MPQILNSDRVPWPEIVNAGEEDLVNGLPDKILALIFSKTRRRDPAGHAATGLQALVSTGIIRCFEPFSRLNWRTFVLEVV